MDRPKGAWYNIRKDKVFALRKIAVGAPPLLLLRRNAIFRFCALIYGIIYARTLFLRLEEIAVSALRLLPQSGNAFSSGLCYIMVSSKLYKTSGYYNEVRRCFLQ